LNDFYRHFYRVLVCFDFEFPKRSETRAVFAKAFIRNVLSLSLSLALFFSLTFCRSLSLVLNLNVTRLSLSKLKYGSDVSSTSDSLPEGDVKTVLISATGDQETGTNTTAITLDATEGILFTISCMLLRFRA
jgi:hypothetical protein